MAAEAVVVEGGQKVAMVDEEGHQSRSNQLQECAARSGHCVLLHFISSSSFANRSRGHALLQGSARLSLGCMRCADTLMAIPCFLASFASSCTFPFFFKKRISLSLTPSTRISRHC